MDNQKVLQFIAERKMQVTHPTWEDVEHILNLLAGAEETDEQPDETETTPA